MVICLHVQHLKYTFRSRNVILCIWIFLRYLSSPMFQVMLASQHSPTSPTIPDISQGRINLKVQASSEHSTTGPLLCIWTLSQPPSSLFIFLEQLFIFLGQLIHWLKGKCLLISRKVLICIRL